MKFLRALALVFACAILLASCSSDDSPTGPPPIYSSIVITGPDTLLIGQNGTFVATVVDTGGNPVASPVLTFTTSATAVATINAAGVATAVSEGTVLVRASGGGIVSNALPLTVLQGLGWVDQSAAAATLQNLNGAHFINPREGWVVGDLGTILHTVDAGKTWTAQPSNSTGYTLNAVAFVAPTIGVVIGSAGRILRTTNGGTTWTPVTAPTDGLALNDIDFQDPTGGWIVGNNGLILRSINGGASWMRVVPSPTTANLERVSFPHSAFSGTPPVVPYGAGWIVGAAGTILGSRDFGLTWRVVSPFVTTDPLFGLVRHDVANALAVGSNNRVLATFASGDSALWQLAPAPTPFTNFTALSWPTAGSAWAVGKRPDLALPVVLYSDDAGLSWTDQALPGTAPLSGNGLNDVFFLDDLHGWAVGNQGLVLHTATGGR